MGLTADDACLESDTGVMQSKVVGYQCCQGVLKAQAGAYTSTENF